MDALSRVVELTSLASQRDVSRSLVVDYTEEPGHGMRVLRMRYLVFDDLAAAEAIAGSISGGRGEPVAMNEISETTNIPVEVASFWDEVGRVEVAGVPVRELLSFDGVSLWPHLTEHFSYSEVDDCVRFIEHLDRLLVEVRPRILFVNERYADLARQLAGRRGAVVRSHGTREARGRALPRRRCERAAALRQRIRRTLECVLARALFARAGHRLPPGAILLGSFQRNYRFRPSGEMVDDYFDRLVDAVEAGLRRRPVGIDLGIGPMLAAYVRMRRARTRYPIVPFALFRSPRDSARIAAARQHFLELRERILASPEFRSGFAYRGVPLADQLAEPLSDALGDVPTRAVEDIVTARRMLSELRPAGVMVVYEVGRTARSIVIAAREAGVPTIGIGHGVFLTAAPYYLMRGQGARWGERGTIGFLPPDRTLVFAELDRRTMTQIADYPTAAVRVTGDWRLDDMHALIAEGGSPAARARLGLPAWGRVLGIFTSGYSGRSFASVLEHLDLFEEGDWYLLVKVHPSAHIRSARRLIPSRWRNRTIVLNDHLAEALVASDLVVLLYYSSVIADALCAGKELIIADFTKRYQMPLLDLESVVRSIPSDSDQLRAMLIRYLAGERITRPEGYPQMVKELAFAFDGRSTERATRELLSIISPAR